MKKFLFLIIITLPLLGIGCQSPSPATSEATDKPNIVFVLSDDQRYDTMEAMPALSEFMAKGGTVYQNAYVTTPLCCPSRASILTGNYAHNHGVLGNREPYGFNAFDDSSTLATWLHDAGYRTVLMGKYLNDYNSADADYLPPGWDEFHAFVDKPGYDTFILNSFKDGEYRGNENITQPDDEDSTVHLMDLSIAFMEVTRLEHPDQPFFLFFTPFAPHDPSTPSDKYKQDPATFEQDSLAYNETDVSDKSSLGSSLPLLSERDEQLIERSMKNVHGSLRDLDDAIAALVRKLESMGELDNTVIIFMSDNGVHWGEHRIASGKATPYEEAIRVPLYMYDGRYPLADVDDRLILNIDIAPTIMGLAGLPVPTVDGKSLTNTHPWREIFLTEGYGGADAMPFTSAHSKEAVYIRFENGEEELYDLTKDPYQLENVASDPSYTKTKSTLADALNSLVSCVGATCP